MADKAKPEIKKEERTTVISHTAVSTPDGTTLYYMPNSTMVSTEWQGTGYTGVTTAVGDWVVRKLKLSKKKKGDTSTANSPSNRLKILTPVVMYRFIKSRFRLLERKRLGDRLEKIAKLMENAKVLGQIAMADRIGERFGKLIREQELLACGYREYIPKKLAEKFMDITTTKVIKLTPLKNYVRVLPKNVQKKIEEVQEKKLFDSLLVMHTDVNNTAIQKTAAEKKDPILFGTFNDAPDNLYHIISWVDDLCDLTFDKLIDELKVDKEDAAIETDVGKAFMEAIL